MKRRPAPDWMIMAFVVFVYGGLLAFLLLLNQSVQASSGPAKCNDLPKAGSVTLHPNGTANAMTQVVFTTPFCSDGLAAFSTVDNGNTAGEATGAKAWGVTAVNVSIQLDAPSNDEYVVYWRVEKATQ